MMLAMHEHDSDRAARAAQAVARRREHTRALRLRVAAVAVAIFSAAWGLIFFQLVDGRDPALAGQVTNVVTQSSGTSQGGGWDGAMPSDAAATASGGSADDRSAQAQQSAPSPVTTRQS
jgi:membrane-associated phospholipid phosphatase